ncbi:hypothetical protein HK102_012636, partial [Quaeritorhiza haematococci]
MKHYGTLNDYARTYDDQDAYANHLGTKRALMEACRRIFGGSAKYAPDFDIFQQFEDDPMFLDDEDHAAFFSDDDAPPRPPQTLLHPTLEPCTSKKQSVNQKRADGQAAAMREGKPDRPEGEKKKVAQQLARRNLRISANAPLPPPQTTPPKPTNVNRKESRQKPPNNNEKPSDSRVHVVAFFGDGKFGNPGGQGIQASPYRQVARMLKILADQNARWHYEEEDEFKSSYNCCFCFEPLEKVYERTWPETPRPEGGEAAMEIEGAVEVDAGNLERKKGGLIWEVKHCPRCKKWLNRDYSGPQNIRGTGIFRVLHPGQPRPGPFRRGGHGGDDHDDDGFK